MTADEVRRALENVMDPELGRSIVEFKRGLNDVRDEVEAAARAPVPPEGDKSDTPPSEPPKA